MKLLKTVAYIMSLLFLKYPVSFSQNCKDFWKRWHEDTCRDGRYCMKGTYNGRQQQWNDGKLICHDGIPDINLIKCTVEENDTIEKLRMENCLLSQFNMNDFLHQNRTYVIEIYYNSTKVTPMNVDFSEMPFLREIIINGSRTGGEFNLTFDSQNQIALLTIYNHDIIAFPKALFKNLSELKELRIEKGELQSLNKDMFVGLESLMDLSLADNDIDDIEPDTFTELLSLLWLDLSGNKLTVIKNLTSPSLIDLQFINLSNNFFLQFPFVLTVLHNLLSVDIQNNNLTILPLFLMNSSTGFQMALSGNEWKCDCASCSSLEWIKENIDNILDYEAVTCSKYIKKSEDIIKLNINNSTIEELCECKSTDGFSMLYCVLISLLVLLPLVAILIFVYKNYRFKSVRKEILPKERTLYDAFVWHHDSDKKFVNLMIARLEPEHRLFLHQRDWLSYGQAREKIIYSMENSKFVILILSRNFINSDIFQVQFRSIYYEMPRKRGVIIPIFLDDVSSDRLLPSEFRHLWYLRNRLRWSDKRLWKKLLHFLDSTNMETLPTKD